ncbi:MAG: adenylate/guanylate cyclase domain-containing protein, partial [Actinomycetota bacterium]|nr:adenylate/guanylate cyclase domain-containing protein [Actinomycetota bacterium]
MAHRAVPSRRRSSVLPVAVWVLHIALPILGLWLLIARPEFDVRWENHHAHFWLVTAAAGINVLLAVRVSEQARQHSDARLLLVSLGFLAAAGFLGLHALATPGVIVPESNAGFAVATPVGLGLAAAFAAWSAADFKDRTARRIVRMAFPLRVVLLL